jgi:UDPglucose 6-dehydrogenase
MRLSVVGLGKLGAPLAAVLASRGHEVVGVDVSADAVTLLNAGTAPVEETGLQELLSSCGTRLRATLDTAEAVLASEATFVIVPTPSGPDGTFSLHNILPVMETVGAALRSKDSRHVVVITSTVMPGATAGAVREALERASGLKVGVDVGLCYSPEFIALGSVIHDMCNPDFILVGESDAASGDLLEQVLRSVAQSDPSVMRMNLVNAELAKIAVNTFVTTKISFANMLGEMCERMAGADVDVVTGAIGLDTRIGSKYLRGATGYGGPCFPRDNVAFSRLARSLGASPDIAEATDAVNRRQPRRVIDLALAALSPNGRAGVLGLAYKPATGVSEASDGVAIARMLADRGVEVTAYDPRAMAEARSALGPAVSLTESARACVENADVVVVATAWPEFAELDAAAFAREGPVPPTVIDCWGILDRSRLGGAVNLVRLGAAPQLARHDNEPEEQ